MYRIKVSNNIRTCQATTHGFTSVLRNSSILYCFKIIYIVYIPILQYLSTNKKLCIFIVYEKYDFELILHNNIT